MKPNTPIQVQQERGLGARWRAGRAFGKGANPNPYFASKPDKIALGALSDPDAQSRPPRRRSSSPRMCCARKRERRARRGSLPAPYKAQKPAKETPTQLCLQLFALRGWSNRRTPRRPAISLCQDPSLMPASSWLRWPFGTNETLGS